MREQLKSILLRHEGRDNPIKARELAELLNEPERTVRLAIRSLVDEGLPVCSTTASPQGYFIPLNMTEARESTEPMRAVYIDTFVRRRRILRNVALYLQNGKQMTLNIEQDCEGKMGSESCPKRNECYSGKNMCVITEPPLNGNIEHFKDGNQTDYTYDKGIGHYER